MKHTHAELMMEYAKDAMETDEPWLRWEFFSKTHNSWISCHIISPSWDEDTKYRRKLKTININGHEVPEPYRGEMEEGDPYYVVSLNINGDSLFMVWYDECYCIRAMARGLVHLNKEAAIAHTQALLSFTEV